MYVHFYLFHVRVEAVAHLTPVETRANSQTNGNATTKAKAGRPRTIYAHQVEERGAGEEAVWEKGMVSERRREEAGSVEGSI